MKIYGQGLREIFDNLPWQYKIVVAVGSVFILFVIVYVPLRFLNLGISHRAATASPLRISSTQRQTLGMLDPALAYNPATGVVWMAYAAEESTQDSSSGALLNVRLAKAQAGACENWNTINGGIEAKSDDILAPDGQTIFRTGVWRVETPGLVFDPDDKGREWKLYAYKYFWAHDPASTLQVAQHYGMIVYKYTSDPLKGWSTEQWLLSPAPDYPPPPYEQMVLQHLNTLDPSLQNVTAYARPSVIYRDRTLLMTLSAFTGGTTPDRIVMLSSRDHGASWQYVNTLLQKSDITRLGPYTILAGASLIEQEGQVYLAAVLGDQGQRGKGTFFFPFQSVGDGLLQRDDKTGAPLLLRHQPLQGNVTNALGGGFAAYTDACKLGLLTAEQIAGTSSFQIYKTYQKPVQK